MRLLGSTLIVVTLIVGGALLGCYTSLWLLWHLVPEGAKGALAMRTLADTELYPLATQAVPAEVLPLIDYSSRIAWGGRGESLQMVILPRLRSWKTLPYVLQDRGWHVQRLGILIRATRGHSSTVPFTHALRAYGRVLLRESVPVAPVALVRFENNLALPFSQPLLLTAVAQQGQVRVVIEDTAMNPIPPLPLPPPAASGQLTLTVPGPMLASLPREVADQVNRLLVTALGFPLTHPNILAAVAAYDTVQIVMERHGASTPPTLQLGVMGDTHAFQATVQHWIQEEERRGRLTTRAFRLPDGTLGYEKVPGEIVPVLTASTEGCWEPVQNRTELWLCTRGTTLGIGKSQAAALQAAQLSELRLMAAIDSAMLAELTQAQDCTATATRSLLWCQLQSLRLSGVHGRLAAELTIN